VNLTISSNKSQTVSFDLKPINNIIPKTTSRITKKSAIANENGTKKGKLKTGSPKYSANLYEKPSGSFSLINPEIIKSIPTKILENWVILFLSFVII
jgi:hypothetical protein